MSACEQIVKRIMVASQIDFFDVREFMAISREVFNDC